MVLTVVALLSTAFALLVLHVALYRSAALVPARVELVGPRERGRRHQF